ncbi:hypothetical protein L3Q82_009485 [Scortum barcoo]|uniref:Uncharacterized protein n=1 Tax=Scortum barcoo TaxID=214431 RepID=A0ACB8WGW2_9TELE|nr:hypothetical protein L3Q82_009485 [Scortum barcoo]
MGVADSQEVVRRRGSGEACNSAVWCRLVMRPDSREGKKAACVSSCEVGARVFGTRRPVHLTHGHRTPAGDKVRVARSYTAAEGMLHDGSWLTSGGRPSVRGEAAAASHIRAQGKATVQLDSSVQPQRPVEFSIVHVLKAESCQSKELLTHVTGQTKSGSQAHHEQKNIKDRYVARIRRYGAPPWSQAWGWGSQAARLVAGSLPTGPGRAQPEMATWARLPVGSPPAGRDMECHLAGGKEPELVREVERYRLEIVGLTSTHSLGSGTQLLERGWTLHYSGVAQGERRRAGVGLLIAPQLSRHVLEFTPVNERVASLRLRVGDRSLAVVCAYGPNSSTEYPAFLESLGGVLDSAPTGETPLFYWGTSTLTWATTVIPGGA